MNAREKAVAVELIRRIQAQGGSPEDFRMLEWVTDNPDVWIAFDVLELEGLAPDKVFNLLSGPP